MDIHTIRELQAYGFFFFVLFLVFILYGYYFHLYKTERSGKRNYEKYSDLVLNDSLNDVVLEQNTSGQKGL